MLITVADVPAHPLLVHAVVVLIPLAALVALRALAGAVTATPAKFAGDHLAAALDITAEFAPVIAEHGSACSRSGRPGHSRCSRSGRSCSTAG